MVIIKNPKNIRRQFADADVATGQKTSWRNAYARPPVTRDVIFVFILFWLLLIWGLWDGDIYGKEAAIYGVLWCVLIAGFFVLPRANICFIIGTVLLDLLLIMKVLGQDIRIN